MIIESDDFRKLIDEYNDHVRDKDNGLLMGYEVAQMIDDCIEKTPVIEARPVRRGRWIEKGNNYVECPWCYSCYTKIENLNFCACCGAQNV